MDLTLHLSWWMPGTAISAIGFILFLFGSTTDCGCFGLPDGKSILGIFLFVAGIFCIAGGAIGHYLT